MALHPFDERIEFVPSDDPDFAGWYITSYDVNGQFYDAIGPFETKEKARRLIYETACEEYGELT